MAQFDVHRNPGRHRDRIPFVVTVQSTLYDDYRRRVVVPLVGKEFVPGKLVNPRFNPTFRVKGAAVVLHPLEIVSVAMENLGERVGSLAEEGDKIMAALDELLTRWR
jgi:toxin CcdB